MAGDCPALGPHDPLVRGLLGTVDCNVQSLVQGGYSALFQPNSAFSGLLTAILTIYVAVIGYQLLLGRSRLGVGDFALSAAKIGAVLALATQWGTYQALVYRSLFDGPQQVADALLRSLGASGAAYHGDVFTGLQRAFDDLSAGAASFAQHGAATAANTPMTPVPGLPTTVPGVPAPVAPSTTAAQVGGLLSGDSFGAAMLAGTAAVLLISTLGVLLAAKIVLGVLLGLGPIFIALFLFTSTRGVFEGWLRASLAFAFAPLMATLLTGIALTMLEPALVEMEQLRDQGVFQLAPVYTVTLLVLVFAAVSLGMLAASGIVAAGFRLPGPRIGGLNTTTSAPSPTEIQTTTALPRAARVAAATAAQDRRDALMFASQGASDIGERRLTVASTGTAAARATTADVPSDTRLGQGARRSASPRTLRGSAPRMAR